MHKVQEKVTVYSKLMWVVCYNVAHNFKWSSMILLISLSMYHGTVHLYVLVSVKITKNHAFFCSCRLCEERFDKSCVLLC